MLRSLLLLLTVALVGAAQGCRICDSPYDYSGPVMPCGEGCGCGHSGHGHGGYVESGYSGGHGGCSTCGNDGGMSGHSHEYESMPVMEGQPIPAPEMMPQQSPRATTKSVLKPATKASYEAPLRSARTQSSASQTKSVRSPYPALKNPGSRLASTGTGPNYR